MLYADKISSEIGLSIGMMRS